MGNILSNVRIKTLHGDEIIGLNREYVDGEVRRFCEEFGEKNKLDNSFPNFGRVIEYPTETRPRVLGDMAYIAMASILSFDLGKIVGIYDYGRLDEKTRFFAEDIKNIDIVGVVNAKICKVPKNKDEMEKTVRSYDHPFFEERSPLINKKGIVSVEQYLEEDPRLYENLLQLSFPRAQSIYFIKELKSLETGGEVTEGLQGLLNKRFKEELLELKEKKDYIIFPKGRTLSLRELIESMNIQGVANRIEFLTRARVEPKPDIEGFNPAEKFKAERYAMLKIILPGVLEKSRKEFESKFTLTEYR